MLGKGITKFYFFKQKKRLPKRQPLHYFNLIILNYLRVIFILANKYLPPVPNCVERLE